MDDAGSGSTSKVDRTMDEYGLDGFGAELEAAWTGEDGDRTSLRSLAEEFNRTVLGVAMREADGSTSRSDVDSAHRTLTDDDAPRSEVLRTRRELERSGVDVDAVLDDFVSHQTIHTYLTRDRGVRPPDEDVDRIDERRETIERLAGRTEAVTESAVESLADAGRLADRPYEVFVDVRVTCGACGTDYRAGELLRRGGCGCAVE
ncbi:MULTISPECIES: rod-determining factor RdfA [Haloferacaceae]|uniref:Rod-determining factor RdfA n=1 Tax=Halorubrum glutamatedens TaxID=2707018 RepID=A0ABD5QNE3_9EURY|nr:rod-determining factor RdfA [Halobellus captivus]